MLMCRDEMCTAADVFSLAHPGSQNQNRFRCGEKLPRARDGVRRRRFPDLPMPVVCGGGAGMRVFQGRGWRIPVEGAYPRRGWRIPVEGWRILVVLGA
eukprot:s3204_g4.t1